MMEREWTAILHRYGQTVLVDGKTVRAFLQPVCDEKQQVVPTPAGMRQEERVLWLGPVDCPLRPGGVVRWHEVDYAVRSTRQVGDGHHVWAILQRMEGQA